MLKNHLLVAVRTLRRRKGYAALNVAGLTLGIACCLLIGLYVRHEWSYDRFHDHADRLYRLVTDHRPGADLPPPAPEAWRAWGSGAIAPLLQADFPEVEHVVRLSGRHQILLTRGERKVQEERYFFADPAFFDVFGFRLLRGDPATALAEPHTIVLAEGAARRYFGDEDPMGQALRLGSGDDARELVVTGVLEDPPTNTHLGFDLLLSMRTFEHEVRADSQDYKFDSWGYVDFFTYVLLREGASEEALRAKLPDFVDRHYLDDAPSPQTYRIDLEPITEAYFSPTGSFAAGPRGSETNLYLFSAIGLFILLIACVNFMNLATARASARAKEVGVRKAVGARRHGLIGQFLAEAVLMAAAATALALVLAHLALPLFRALSGKAIPPDGLSSLPVLGALIGGTLIVGLLAGSYPALVLSAFRPAAVLKGNFATSRRGVALRKGLVIFQFAAAVVLIIGTLAVRDQLRYLQARPLGFDDTQQLVLDFGGDGQVQRAIASVKQRLAALPGVRAAAASRSVPGGYFPHAGSTLETPDGTMREIGIALYEIDADFLPLLGVEAAAGRLFSADRPADAEDALLINEATARELGYATAADAVGRRFTQWGREGTIVGVVEDFNYESLHYQIDPLSFRLSPWLNYVVLQVATEDAAAVVAQAEAAWAELVPHRPFRYSFLDQSFDAQYRAEERFGALFGTFAGLAIVVACLGLFGLAAYAAEQRTKEVGIRKVLGAGVPGLVALLAKDFVVLVGAGFVVAAPVAYLAMERWLDGFAYRTDLGVAVFALAGGAVLVIALLTVSAQSIRAATANPVEALRYE